MISLDVNMFCAASVVCIVHAFHCLTVYANRLAWVGYGTCETIPVSLMKTLTAGIVAVAGMLSAYHDIALAAAMVFVIGTIGYSTG